MSDTRLKKYFVDKMQEANRLGFNFVDLKRCAEEVGVSSLHQIGMAARQLANELGDAVRLEATIDGAILWLEKPAGHRCQKLRLDPALIAHLAALNK